VLDVVLIVLGVALLAMYISWTAGRLDRLHNRTEAAHASLDAQLVRRAVAAEELARAAGELGLLPQAAVDRVVAAGQQALTAGPADRQDRAEAEQTLGTVLREVFGDPDVGGRLAREPQLASSLSTLDDAMTRLVLARRFLAVAVHDTRALRERRLVRILRLAGHAQLPDYFDIDDTPVPLAISPVSGPR